MNEIRNLAAFQDLAFEIRRHLPDINFKCSYKETGPKQKKVDWAHSRGLRLICVPINL